MARKAPTFYVFHGDDEYSIKARVSDFRQQMGDDLNISEFDGTKASPAEVIAAAQAMPFLSDRRLVLVYGMLHHLGRRGAGKTAKAQLEQLVKALTQLPESARLVFVESTTLSDKHAVIQLAHEDPTGYIKAFNPPKNPTTWIQRRSQDYHVQIEGPALRALVAVIDNDLRKADNELYKLASYVGVGGTITEADVMALTPYVAEADVFAMVDAIGRRDGKNALRELHRLLDQQQQDPMQLFAMIIRQFRLILQAREIIDAGGNSKVVAQKVGIHPFVAEKVSNQARGFTISQLEAIYRNLLEIDVGVKTGRVEIVVGLDLFVAGITGE